MQLGHKMILGAGAVLFLTSSVIVGVLVTGQAHVRSEASATIQDTILDLGVGKIEVALASDRIDVIKQTIERMRQFDTLHGLVLQDSDGDTLLSVAQDGAAFTVEKRIADLLARQPDVVEGPRHYHLRKLRDGEGDPIGSVTTCFDSTAVETRARSDLWTAVLMGSVVFLLAMVVNPVLMRRITRPILELRDRLRDISNGRGDLTAKVEIRGSDEIGELAAAFNRFVDNLREMLIEVRDATAKIDTETRSIDRDSQAIHDMVRTQEQSIEDVRGVVDALASAFNDTVGAARHVDELSEVSREHANQGVERIAAFVEAMQQVRESNARISAAIDVVDSLARRTNMLALNAAVEAARAGVHGKGFAVVAEEVRSLANRSTETARGINAAIAASADTTESAARDLVDLQETLKRIAAGSNEIKSSLTTVNAAVGQQVRQMDGVGECFEKIKRLAQESSTNTVKLATQSDRTADEVTNLNHLLARFSL